MSWDSLDAARFRTDKPEGPLKHPAHGRDAFPAALRKVELRDSPRGPFELDADNNPVQNAYIRKVEKVGGRLQNTVIYTYPDVSQYWKYSREEYLKQPLYDRNNPPCRFCQ